MIYLRRILLGSIIATVFAMLFHLGDVEVNIPLALVVGATTYTMAVIIIGNEVKR